MASTTFDPSARPTYTPSQIQAYLSTISLPKPYLSSPVLSNPHTARFATHGLPFLAALQKHQLASIPFENLTLHYNPSHSVTLEPAFVHDKFVARECGRGGRCMENNLLFYTVLRSLGYAVTSVAGRVNEAVQPVSAKAGWAGPKYDGWNHRITLVHFDGEDDADGEGGKRNGGGGRARGGRRRSFLVDTGFGATCPNQPMELDRSSPTTVMNVPPSQESRLRWTRIPDTVDKEQHVWVYEIRFKSDAEWAPAYCFTETEFLPSDYATMSFFTSNNPRSWFTFSVVCVKMLLGKASRTDRTDGRGEGSDGEGEQVIVGDVTLFNNEVKRRLYGNAEVVETLKTEEQRINALRKWFDITLTEAEVNGIKGTVTALG